MKMMRWNRILPILLGVMLISKGSVNGQDQDDDDDWGGFGGDEDGTTPRDGDPDARYHGSVEETTQFDYGSHNSLFETTESDNVDRSSVEETTEYSVDAYTDDDEDDDDVPTTEEPVTLDSQDSVQYTETPEVIDYTSAETEDPEIQFGGYSTEDPLGAIPTAPKEPVDQVTDASEEETTVEPNQPTPWGFPWGTDAPAGDKTEETTVEPIQTTAKFPWPVFGTNAPEGTTTEETSEEPTVETSTDDMDPAGTGGKGTDNTDQYGNLITSTEVSVDQPTTVDNPQVNQRGGPRQPNPIEPAVLDSLPVKSKTNLSLDTLPDGRPIKDLGEEFEVVGAGGVAGGDFSKIIANKHGFYVLHPVQTKAQDIIFDPYTIGQVLGYLYEFNEFQGQRPKDGWTAELMGYKIPQLIKKKRSAGVRRATLVFKKKPEVVAKEEKEYWKQFIASI